MPEGIGRGMSQNPTVILREVREDAASLSTEQCIRCLKKKNSGDTKELLELKRDRENSTGGLVDNTEDIS